MRNVVYVAPFPLETTLRFSQAIAGLDGVRLLGVFQQPPAGPGAALFHDIALVEDALNPQHILDGCRRLAAKHGALHRVTGILENLQEQLADVRAVLGIEGPDPATARRFRDKGVMKQALRAAGLPCARHARIRAPGDGAAFAAEVGYPLVLKPPAGAGCRSTWRIDEPAQLHAAIDALKPSPQNEVLGEEFLVGAEYSFETITLGGQVCFSSATRYFPTPLEVTRKDWIQWCILFPRTIEGAEYDGVRELGQRAVRALGLRDGMTHMEWFRRPDGSLAIGEIAARPPGAQILRLTSYGHDTDIYRAWARCVVDGAFDGPWARKYAVGVAFLRGPGRGRITAVEGLDEAQARMGEHVVEARLPQVGMMKADGYEGEGWAIVRHPDTEVVKRALFELITTVKVRYGG
ncbi:MAG: ATP-grasp domain-containing protein [Alphaproteobacteria bacterium]|nr:ATP-grasp domain-containing protein [Alphaproteobacteria bacterium]